MNDAVNLAKSVKLIPHGDPRREENLAAWHEGSHPLLKNKNGKPKTFYHGTQSDISTFRRSQTGEFGPGIYATDMPDEAADYAGTHPFSGKGPSVIPIHVRMKNPFIVKNHADEFWNKFGGKTDEEATFNAMAAGYDGVIFKRPYSFYDEKTKQIVKTGQDHTHYVVFSPNQIKSATGNNGNFDPTNPDITKAKGGDVEPSILDSEPKIELPNNLKELLSWKKDHALAPAPELSAAPEHKPTMDEVFTSPQSGYEGATPIMMPSSLQEILKWERTPHKSEGGELDDEHPDQFRELNKLGLYSKAAEVAQGATGQNIRQTPEQWHNYLIKRDVKPDEIKWSHMQNAFDPNEKVHKDDLAAHFNYNNQEPYTEQVYKDGGHDYENNENGIGQLALDMEQDPELFKKVIPQKHLQEHAKRKDAEGESVSDWLLDEWPESLENYISKQQNTEGHLPTRHSGYQMEGPSENYREVVLQHNPEDEKFQEFAHYPNAINPLLHIRMSDRKGLNGEKLLHIEELQSDWGQQGADAGFNEQQKKAKEEKFQALNREMHALDFTMRNRARKAKIDAGANPDLVDNSDDSLHRIMQEHATPEEFDHYLKLKTNHDKALNDFRAPMIEEGPHVGDTNKWTDLGLKRILKEAADGGYHGITFAPGKTQAARWSTPGLEKPYDVTIPSRMQKLINRHDDSLKFQPYSMPISFNEPYKAHYLPMSEKAATSIKEGQERFRRGGEVNKSVAQSPKMIHNPPIIGHALNKIRSLPQDSGQPLSGKQGRLF